MRERQDKDDRAGAVAVEMKKPKDTALDQGKINTCWIREFNKFGHQALGGLQQHDSRGCDSECLKRTTAGQPHVTCRFAILGCSSASLFLTFLISFSVLLKTEFFEAVLERTECEAEEFGGLGDVVVGAFHRL